MTFTQTEKADNAFTDCSANGLCLAVIQMGSSFQTVSLQQPGPNISGDIVPFIFSGIDDFIDYIENGAVSSASIFLQFPEEFDYSNPEHMVLFKRSTTQKTNGKPHKLCDSTSCDDLDSIRIGSQSSLNFHIRMT